MLNSIIFQLYQDTIGLWGAGGSAKLPNATNPANYDMLFSKGERGAICVVIASYVLSVTPLLCTTAMISLSPILYV